MKEDTNPWTIIGWVLLGAIILGVMYGVAWLLVHNTDMAAKPNPMELVDVAAGISMAFASIIGVGLIYIYSIFVDNWTRYIVGSIPICLMGWWVISPSFIEMFG